MLAITLISEEISEEKLFFLEKNYLSWKKHEAAPSISGSDPVKKLPDRRRVTRRRPIKGPRL